MKTKTYNTYSFAELSAGPRSRAIEDHRQFLAENFDDSCTTDDAKAMLSHAGFTVDRVFWSGFSSQGDGACFEGSWKASAVNEKAMRDNAPRDTELHRIADGMQAIACKYPYAYFTVKQSGHYQHKYCTEFAVSMVNEDGDEMPGAQEAEKEVIELARDAMEWIYRQLQKQYEWELEEAQVVESIEANGYEFTGDGKIS